MTTCPGLLQLNTRRPPSGIPSRKSRLMDSYINWIEDTDKDAYPRMLLARTKNEDYQYEGIKIVDIAKWLSES